MYLGKLVIILLIAVLIEQSFLWRRRRRRRPPLDCTVGQWTSWGACTHNCGNSGTQSRTRIKLITEANGGQCPYQLKELRSCNRFCLNGGTLQNGFCSCGHGFNGTCCEKVHGGYSVWQNVGICSKTCGGGSQTQQRSCTNPAPSNGGNPCSGPNRRTLACQTQTCPVDGGYSDWQNVSSCSVKCGGGSQSQQRNCTNPAPSNGGKPCSGPRRKTVSCQIKPCPGFVPDLTIRRHNATSIIVIWVRVAGAAKYIIFSQEVGVTTKNCKEVPAGANDMRFNVAFSGLKPGARYQFSARTIFPVDGGYADWLPFTICSKTCSGGTQFRNRSCTNPPPLLGGKRCNGIREEIRPCNSFKCPSSSKTSDSKTSVKVTTIAFACTIPAFGILVVIIFVACYKRRKKRKRKMQDQQVQNFTLPPTTEVSQPEQNSGLNHMQQNLSQGTEPNTRNYTDLDLSLSRRVLDEEVSSNTYAHLYNAVPRCIFDKKQSVQNADTTKSPHQAIYEYIEFSAVPQNIDENTCQQDREIITSFYENVME